MLPKLEKMSIFQQVISLETTPSYWAVLDIKLLAIKLFLFYFPGQEITALSDVADQKMQIFKMHSALKDF